MTTQTQIELGQSRIAFDRIELGPNVRQRYHGIAELAQDIATRGLLNNLVVRVRKLSGDRPHVLPNGERVFVRYFLAAGFRRYHAIAKLREDRPHAFDEINVALFKGSEEDALAAQLAENLAREDLSPTEIMAGVRALAEKGLTQAAIAEKLAKTQGWVSRILKVQENCVEEVHDALAKGSLSMEAAYALAALDQPKQIEALAKHSSEMSAGGKGAARKAAHKAAGKSVRPGVKEIKERLAYYTDESKAESAPIIRKTLRWVLGETESL